MVTRAYASKRMLSSRVCLMSARRARLRMAARSAKLFSKALYRFQGGAQQLSDFAVPARVRGLAPLAHFAQPVVQGLDELPAPFRIVDEIVLQEGIAVHDPDIAQHFIEHAGRTAGAAFRAQFIQQIPPRPFPAAG